MKIGFHCTLLVIFLVLLQACCDCPDTTATKDDTTENTEAPAHKPTLPVTPEGHAHGIDVSHYQGTVVWDKVKESGVSFAFAKATGGIYDTDPQFKNNWAGMKAAGVIRGAYHFYHANYDPTRQAEYFISVVSQIEDGDLPPVVDLEAAGMVDGITVEKYAADVKTYLNFVESNLGIKPIIYSNPYFANKYLIDPFFGDYVLWVAEYSSHAPVIPTGWAGGEWTFWQHEASGTVPGINGNVDHNYFHKDEDALGEAVRRWYDF